ncbi:MAG: formate dehydrogenase accessory sulfurtransferase FdhD [Actinomycetia bacterium]|nr:formate dehydrogenase accessory sulfurtransferase FdhD [Actinomycetes bacterium]
MELGNSIKIEKIRSGGKREKKADLIPQEALLHLYLNGHKICVISCSPEDLIELAIGYVFSHGYVDAYKSINIIEMCGEDIENGNRSPDEPGMENISAKIRADVVMRGKIEPGYISSGCGSIDGKDTASLPSLIKSKITVSSDTILGLNRKNLSAQKHKKALGGLHSASLFDIRGMLLLVREDIGRHNCLDKIIGHTLINDMDLSDKMIFTSGRVSIDLVLKAGRILVPVVVTNSSVTHSAAMMAQRLGLTIIGYARGNRFNIYSCPERIM